MDVTPDGEPTDSYDYEVTCADFDTEDPVHVWALNPEVGEDGNPEVGEDGNPEVGEDGNPEVGEDGKRPLFATAACFRM